MQLEMDLMKLRDMVEVWQKKNSGTVRHEDIAMQISHSGRGASVAWKNELLREKERLQQVLKNSVRPGQNRPAASAMPASSSDQARTAVSAQQQPRQQTTNSGVGNADSDSGSSSSSSDDSSSDSTESATKQPRRP